MRSLKGQVQLPGSVILQSNESRKKKNPKEWREKEGGEEGRKGGREEFLRDEQADEDSENRYRVYTKGERPKGRGTRLLPSATRERDVE